jgi:hypothetical protein
MSFNAASEGIEDRVASLEEKIDRLAQLFQRNVAVTEEHGTEVRHHSPLPADPPAQEPSVDVQGEFRSIKDSLQQLKLPASLRLNADRLNIRREDLPMLTVLQKAAKYSETTIKLIDALLARNEDPSVADMMQNILTTQTACIQYLQDEYSALVVHGTVDKDTAKIFRSLQKNTSGLSAANPVHLQHATAIAAARGVHYQSTAVSEAGAMGQEAFKTAGLAGEASHVLGELHIRRTPTLLAVRIAQYR